jgi:uncharacterized protein YbjT (DUF2867 family)
VADVLVTGGTGVLGRHLVRELQGRGRAVRVLSRSEAPLAPSGVATVVGDVRTGTGLVEAVRGVDCIVHAATSPSRHVRSTEVDGTANLLAAATDAGVAHVVYVSIVGVDGHRFPYYRAKHAAELAVEQAQLGWTIQRITQFHELIDQLLRPRLSLRTPNLSFQSIAAADAATRLADLVDSGPVGRAGDLGGPEVLSLREMAAQRHQVTGSRTRLLPLPPVGPLRDWDVGVHLVPARRAEGAITWRAWLAARAEADPAPAG